MMKHKLPANWIEMSSKTHPHRIYYFNIKTNQSSWNKPTVEQTEQIKKKSNGSSRKRKQSTQDNEINEVQSPTSEYNESKKQIFERKKLVAKRFVKQTQKKDNEEKETPQMKVIREKMLKRKEKNSPKTQSSISAKDAIKSQSLKVDETSSYTKEHGIHSNSKTNCTPQMQILLEKIQERNAKSSKTKKVEDVRKNMIYKQKVIKTRLRKKSGCKQEVDLEVISSPLKNRKEEEKQNNLKIAREKNLMNKRKSEENNSIETISTKSNRRSLKKNLGKERMEKLRESLSIKSDDNLNESICTSTNSSSIDLCGKLPNIYKNAEVRLVRLKERFLNDKTFVNKNLCTNKDKEAANSSTESITTVDDLIKQSNENSFYEEMDWEPLEDEKIMFEVQAVRTQLCTETNVNMSYNVPNNILKYPLLSEKQAKNYLYIVVDTNVFLTNIDTIELARETTFKTYDHSLIVIPWTVICELDYIKNDNGKSKPTILCVKARKAINYINKLFSLNQYVIGQTPEDVAKNKEKFSTDCPDDEILQTCLQIRDLGKSVVLLSYDINLCNKAMIYDIITLGKTDPFEKIDYLNASNHVNRSFSSSNKSNESLNLDSTSILCQELYLSDEIYEDIKSIIRDFLTVIVSKEMHTLYGDSWEKYVIIKPPWTTVTVLQCAVKHWIAAISESFERKAEIILKELLQIFKNTSDRKTLKENSYILNKCSDLAQMINIDKHSILMLRISKKIDELKEKCHNYEIEINDKKLCNAIGIENNIEEQERRAQKAFQYFEAAYVYARDMSGMAAEAIGMPCSFHYNILNPVPSIDYIKQIQPELAANVNKLLCSLSAVMEQVKNSCMDHRTLINLHQTLITFLPKTAPIEKNLIEIDIEPLDVYCCIKLRQDVLNIGLHQLQELSTHLCRLASYRCT
ncbi:transcriptional protein SWT1 [Apis mellifera]|uniref:Transcriptional protein SWT1 n=1 Tax=Apis mellifera TaxID=7460 RepID=A0A7M7MR45_APIME|nr:transcriptional protein SWT1 [Apis mellifera]|eukprot:XP_026299733.1 transcriptional protein SWT1 [Apis mellifera]